MNIAFIGLGKMGTGMARNLLRAGHHVTVYNRTRDKAEALSGDSAQIADSPALACRGCEVVMTMLSNDQALEQVVFGDGGILSALEPGRIHVSNSTISTALARRLTAEHANHQQGFISAPVFGRPDAAEAKRLIVAAAGPSEAIARVMPLLDALGRHTYIAGAEAWQANAVKACGNFMIGSMMEAFGEAFALMRKSGVDHHLFFDIINDLFASPVYKNYGGAIADERFEPAGFELKLGLKDIRLVLDAAQEVSTPMPFASVLRDNLVSAIARGQESLDWSSVALIAAKNAGL